MPALISVFLAGLFVFLAAFNTWTMLTGRGSTPHRRKLWARAHRIAGYSFITLFVIFSYFMLLRIKGSAEELSPRIVLHMALALLLGPLLVVKVLVVRYQKGSWGLLMALGIAIFLIATTLVSINVAVHYLRHLSPEKVPFAISLKFIAAGVAATVIAFLAPRKTLKTKPDAATVVPHAATHEPRGGDKVFALTLARIESQTSDAKTLRFVLAPGEQIAARPGQFLTFEWMIAGRIANRSYSICSSPSQTGFIEITPKRVENGLVSRFLNDKATVGLAVRARGPYGQFCFDRTRHDRMVLIAGGSGITPMMAILRYIDDLCIPAKATLVYCARTEQDVFFREELAAIRRRLMKFHYVLVFSRPGSEWTGWKGHLRREILESEVDKPTESTFFLCGPPQFMELGRRLLNEMAVKPSRILQESFGGAVAGKKPTGRESTGPATGSLVARFSRSALACKVSLAETLLQSSEKHGVLIPSGCRQGVCGTCVTRLLSGKVESERGEALNEDLRSQGFILPCVSRPISDITLDA